MRAVSAMFLDAPHVAARYASRLYDDIGAAIFREDHKLLPYMVSAFAAYRLENAFRSGALESAYKPIRYHILMALKYHVLGGKSASLEKGKAEEQSEQIIVALKQHDLIATFRELAQVVIAAGGGQMPSRDRLKRQQFTQDLITELMRD
ncbi:hypothetical protein ACFY7A_33485 [Streptomyces longwoodensis]|uniref:hypothetical protein n=1 Tax=Streptomyces longwoodensis TaxID=68231 RepID=UPI0036C36994